MLSTALASKVTVPIGQLILSSASVLSAIFTKEDPGMLTSVVAASAPDSTLISITDLCPVASACCTLLIRPVTVASGTVAVVVLVPAFVVPETVVVAVVPVPDVLVVTAGVTGAAGVDEDPPLPPPVEVEAEVVVNVISPIAEALPAVSTTIT